MKLFFKTLSVILFFASLSAWSQISFVDPPEYRRVYPRQPSTMAGYAQISGNYVVLQNVNELQFQLYRGTQLQTQYSQTVPLIYSANPAPTPFTYTFSITAEPVLYRIIVRGKTTSNTYVTYLDAKELLAGDAMIVYGQSNAVSSPELNVATTVSQYLSPYIRTYGFSSNTLSQAANTSAYWRQAVAATGGGQIGEWPLVMARTIFNQTQIPLVIFNGGIGGQSIGYFLPSYPYNAADYLNAFDRLKERLDKSRFSKSTIRAWFWWQGEHDTGFPPYNTLNSYFNALGELEAKLSNYLSLERFYLVQIRGAATNKSTTSPPIQEAQRQYAASSSTSHTRLLTANGLNQRTDNIHFTYLNGTEKMGLQMAATVGADLYPGYFPNAVADNPAPISAIRVGNSIVVQMAGNLNLANSGPLETKFRLEGATAALTTPTIQSVVVNNANQQVIINCSGSLAQVTGLTYLSHSGGVNPELYDVNTGKALVSFYRYPVQ